MASNVFLVPCDADDFDRTVRTAVEVGDLPERPAALDDASAVRLWGVPDGSSNESYFEKMADGDLLLFYRDGEVVGTGRVGRTFEDEDGWVSETFWEDTDASRVFTVEEFAAVSVPTSAVNRLFGYADGYTPQGFMRVADDRVPGRLDAVELAVSEYSEAHA
ncbi:hypothetical protein ACFQE1_20850, partial [Halobium palmae]